MKKVLLKTPKVEKYKEWIKEYIEKVPRINTRLPNTRRPLWNKMETELRRNHEFYKFVQTVEEEIKKIFIYILCRNCS